MILADVQAALEQHICQYMDETYTQIPQFFCAKQVQRSHCQAMMHAFSGQIAYAVKANPHPEVIRLLASAGVDCFDVASLNEIALASKLVPGCKLLFNNPVKTPAEIEVAANQFAVDHFTVQSRAEIDKVLKYASVIPLDQLEFAVRLKAPHSSQARISHSVKFGVDEALAEELLNYLIAKGVQKIVLSVHIGSANASSSILPYIDTLSTMLKLIDQFPEIVGLNFGGGFPAYFYPGERPDVPKLLSDLSEHINNVVPKHIKRYIEPGLSMVANATVLVTPVVEVDAVHRTLRIRDGIYTSYCCYFVHQHPISAFLYRREGNGLVKIEATPEVFIVFGQTCDGGDLIEMRLPNSVQPNDMICFETAGAYMGSVATRFNGFDDVPWHFFE